MDNQERQLRREKRERLIYLAERPDFDTNPNVQKEWEKLRDEVWVQSANARGRKSPLVEVIYDGSIIYTGSKKQVRDKCKISSPHLDKLIRDKTPDRFKRFYRKKE
ncbi:hypothetical protein P7I26_00530 [Enterococcus casseliflavus]|uniref:hypothetical protein n=1 Tax=Enterococcus casseliflavus TaxID=37734 RepID=UPI0028919223|nr:hypothetical protein [Enterococcus casseliflavus]MDT2984726.1 hypothetical protein [Enterococcus casseliflavus]